MAEDSRFANLAAGSAAAAVTLPWPVLPALRQLPLLESNGQEICQSKAINRLAGKLAGKPRRRPRS